MDELISSLPKLDETHKRLFAKAGITRTADIWLHAASDVARKLKISVEEVQTAFDAVCCEVAPIPKTLESITSAVMAAPGEGLKFTTGDDYLDERLGGGIPVGMITEISGGSAAGKTQLALQLALTVQLPIEQGGLGAGVAYFPTTSSLPVTRLAEIARNHAKLRDMNATKLTDNIHTCFTPTIPALLTALRTSIQQLFNQIKDGKGRLKPVRLLIIDSLGSLFHSFDKFNTNTLVERSKLLTEIALLLHRLASSRQAAIVVLNQVADVFRHDEFQEPVSNPHTNHASTSYNHRHETNEVPELIYKDQSVWFSRGVFTTPLPPQEATLGLIWANQINMRIMMARTRRRLRPPESEPSIRMQNKRRKGLNGQGIKPNPVENRPAPSNSGFNSDSDTDSGEDGPTDQGIVVRSLSVVFSATCVPFSLDFIVVKEGVQVLEAKPTSTTPESKPVITVLSKPISRTTTNISFNSHTSALSQGFVSARFTQIQEPLDPQVAADAEEEMQTNDGNGPDTGDLEEDEFDVFDEEAWASYGSALDDLENSVNLDELASLAELDDLDDLTEPTNAPELRSEQERNPEVRQQQEEVVVPEPAREREDKRPSSGPAAKPSPLLEVKPDSKTLRKSPTKTPTQAPFQQVTTRIPEEEEVLETSDVEESLIL